MLFKNVCKILILGFLVLLFFGQSLSVNAAQVRWATHSFTNLAHRGTYPESIKRLGYQKIQVDLSPIVGSNVLRATLFVNINPYWYVRFQKTQERKFCLVTEENPENCLPPKPPRFQSFDVTQAVKDAVSAGKTSIIFLLKTAPAHDFGNPPFYKDEEGNTLIHLDVTCDRPLPENHAYVSQPLGLSAYAKDGDTMLVWRDPDPIINSNDITIEEYKNFLKKANNPHEIRFRIYRSEQPITPETIAQAKLIDEIDPFSIWDEEFYGALWRNTSFNNKPVPRLPVKDGVLADYDQGIYVFRNETTGQFYYAVVKAIDGQEDFSQIVPGENSLKEPVKESPGSGLVLLRLKEIRDKFYYVDGPIEMNFFVRWEAPPYSNKPSAPYNYLVARSLNPKHQPPGDIHSVDIGLHCWGGSLLSGYLWWYEAEKGSLLVTTNQRPYDWWTAYSTAYGTYLNYTDTTVENYNQRRILSFVNDFVAKHWQIDPERIILSGRSMGGSGAVMWGVRAGNYFAYVKAGVGIYIPKESPGFTNSFYKVFGYPSWNIPYDDTGLDAYTYWDTERWLYQNVTKETPFIVFANGRNDNAIGWPQAWKVVKAMIATKRPFVFRWDMSGHGCRAHFPGGGDRTPTILIRKDQSLPAFTNCSLDTPLGETPEEAPEKGQINYYLLWKTNDLVDEQSSWEITVYLSQKAPKDSCTVDITPRRLQRFSVKKGRTYHWRNIDLKSNTVIQEGKVFPDEYGLLTLPGVIVKKTANRILISENNFSLVLNPLEIDEPLVVGRSATLAIKATGGIKPYYFALTNGSLPPGLFFDEKTGEIAGTPQKEGSYIFEITISDSSGQTVRKNYILTVHPERLPIPTTEDEEVSEAQKIVVSPEEAEALPSIVASAPPYSTILLEDGYYKLNKTIWIRKEGITIRSFSGNREKVILDGDFKVGEIIGILAPKATIADLTIKRAKYHAIHLGGNGHYVKLLNLHLLDCGEQLVKINPSAQGDMNDYGILANSLLEYTDEGRINIRDPFGNGACYTNGIDALKARGWRVVNNEFKNIYCLPGRSLPQAILFWQGSRDTIIENNKIINCPVGIQLGLGSNRLRNYPDLNYFAPHIGGVVRNNFIFADINHLFDTGIGLWGAKDVKVLNNTIFTPDHDSFASIDLRYQDTQAFLANNLLYKPVTYRGGSAEERKTVLAQAEWFRDPEAGDLHLAYEVPELVDQGISLGDDLVYDIDGIARQGLPDVGADEWQPLLCAPGNLNACFSPDECANAGGFWYEEECHETPPKVLADLVVKRVVTPRYWRHGRRVKVTVLIENVGSANVQKPFAVELYFGEDLIAKKLVSNVAKGKRKLVIFRVLAPERPQRFDLKVIVDRENLISETDKTNNSGKKSIIIR